MLGLNEPQHEVDFVLLINFEQGLRENWIFLLVQDWAKYGDKVNQVVNPFQCDHRFDYDSLET